MAFDQWLDATSDVSLLSGITCAVLPVGNSMYPKRFAFGLKVDACLADLGSRRLLNRPVRPCATILFACIWKGLGRTRWG